MNRDLTQFSPEQTIQEQTLDRSAMERLGTNTSAKWLLEDCELKGDFSRLDLSGFVFRRCMLVETSGPQPTWRTPSGCSAGQAWRVSSEPS